VPVILVSDDAGKYQLRSDCSLRDVSPTLLGMLHLDKPAKMTGGDLRVEIAASVAP
jgi:2,3-bisphosphoglycerate-independent phosphoglycerate mutase